MYAVVGALTTLVNIAAYWGLTRYGQEDVLAATIIAWCAAVTFAYVGNKGWVFDSPLWTAKVLVKEYTAFVGGRLATGFLDVAIMVIFVDFLGAPDMVTKIVANVVVIIGNYVVSKYYVFRRKSE